MVVNYAVNQCPQAKQLPVCHARRYTLPAGSTPAGSIAALVRQTLQHHVQVGVNASSTIILERLIGLDTATAFNITSRDVNVTGIQQVGRRLLLVNVTATLGLDLPSNSSHSSVQAELAVKNLSADEAIHMLSQFPDKFLARTTKVSPGFVRVGIHSSASSHSTLPNITESSMPTPAHPSGGPWLAVLDC